MKGRSRNEHGIRYMILPGLFGLFCVAGCASDDSRVTTNPDGTQSTSITMEDTRREAPKPYDPYKRTAGDAAQDPTLRAQESAQKFPEEEARRRQLAEERRKMTDEERAREKRMVDRTPDTVENYNPTIKERESIPRRF